MSRSLIMVAALSSLACSPNAAPPFDTAAQDDSLRTWANAFETRVNRLGGCGTGADARALFSPDGYLYTTDSATHTLSGEAATEIFASAACSRRSTSFKFDTVVVRSLSPRLGAVIGSYTELATDTANAKVRLRGSAQWIVQQRDGHWIALMVAGTEHSKAVK